MNVKLHELSQLSKRLIEGCRTPAHDGTILFTPDGIASYNALWVRDFAYMVEYAREFIDDREIEAAIRFVMGGKREDGWMPDRIYADGTAIYAAGVAGSPVGQANLDNTTFLVDVIHRYLQTCDASKARSLFREWEAELRQGMAIVPLSANGLVYSDPADPHSPYGFTDTIGKTGELFMESLLYWRACRFLAEWTARYGTDPQSAAFYNERADQIERSIWSLYDDEIGVFYAASGECRQIDIWGNAYLLYIGFPAGDKADKLLNYLHANYSEYVYKGQIRHLPKGQYWERLLIDVPHEEYQNGAYWATASGWVIWCLAQKDSALAAQITVDAMKSFRQDGVFECINEGYTKLDSFVVSATNVYGAVKRLLSAAEYNPEFAAELQRLELSE